MIYDLRFTIYELEEGGAGYGPLQRVIAEVVQEGFPVRTVKRRVRRAPILGERRLA